MRENALAEKTRDGGSALEQKRRSSERGFEENPKMWRGGG